MLKNPEDRRVRRTRRLLKESLLELMREKNFSQITARDVTDNADMNRSTFYLHYPDTTALLQSAEADLLAETQSLVDEYIQGSAADRSIRRLFEPVLDFVVEHREICTMLFENDEASQFTEHLQKLIQRNGAGLVRVWFQPKDEQQVSYLLGFVTYGLITLTTAELLVDGAASGLLKSA